MAPAAPICFLPPMLAIQLFADRDVRVTDIPPPPPPAPDDVTIAVEFVGLNHIDLWGFRGMAFAKRTLPLAVGAEAAGRVVAAGANSGFAVGERVIAYAALVCGHCPACAGGRENLCENPGGVRGFHLDGFAQALTNHPARLCVRIPDGVSAEDAACVPVAYATVEHMLFDNAHLVAGETILIHAGGSGIGTIAIKIARAMGCTVITTVGGPAKVERALALGADHAIDYRADRFEGVVRKLTKKRGVDVVFEHTGADTWSGSLLSLRRGGRLVTCGATSGPSGTINLMQLFQQQYRITGSFGAPLACLSASLARIASGVAPVIDSVIGVDALPAALARLEARDVFGKLLVRMA